MTITAELLEWMPEVGDVPLAAVPGADVLRCLLSLWLLQSRQGRALHACGARNRRILNLRWLKTSEILDFMNC